MTTRVYATYAQYTAYTGDVLTPQPRVTSLLTLASEDLETALVGAVYKTDPQGYPADAGLIDVVMKATCRQVQYMLDQDDDTGVKRRQSSVRMGALSITRAPGTAANALPELGPRVISILRTAGVLPTAPMINW